MSSQVVNSRVASGERSVVGYRTVGDWHGIAEAQGNLGRTAIRQGAYATARSLLGKSLAGYTHLGHRHGTANLEFSLGIVALPPVGRAGYDLTLVALRAELGAAAFAAVRQ